MAENTAAPQTGDLFEQRVAKIAEYRAAGRRSSNGR